MLFRFFKFILSILIIAVIVLASVYFLYKKLNSPESRAAFTYYNDVCQDLIEKNEDCFRIIEGWDNKEVSAYLVDKNFLSENGFTEAAGADSPLIKEFDFLQDKPANVDLEGYLFPDTYRIFKNSDSYDIIRKMLANFNAKLTPELRQEIVKQKKSFFEVLTLASIIEKEVSEPEDMKMVADIFYKRLKAGIALQSDATVNYATGKSLIQPTYQDLSVNSLYNTYRYPGLPPGPISNPGINALKAAIYPTPNPYYYFLTTESGQAIYSKTYEEHLINKNKYLN